MTIKIPIDFSDVEEFQAIDGGVYRALIERLNYLEPRDEDDHPQIKIDYSLLEEGELEGTKLSQWLHLTKKAMYRAKEWFDVFEVEIDELEVDEETGVILNPMLEGAVVEIKVTKEPHYRDRNRKTNKIDGAPFVVKMPKAPSRRAAARDEDEDEAPKRTSRSRASSRDEDDEDEKPARSSTRRSGRTIR